MRLPRWTVYPAIALIATLLVTAVPKRVTVPVPESVKHERFVVLGIDGLDPEILAEVVAKYPERMKNFKRLIEEGTLQPLGTSIPPQSPVAWSNFISGRDPGGHGIYDFIHRDPVTRGPLGSTTKESHGSELDLWGDWKFPLGGDSGSNRTGKAFWQELRDAGVPADIWRMPANFPVEDSLGVSFPGMMTPTLESAYGTYVIYTDDMPVDTHRSGGSYKQLKESLGKYTARIDGPTNPFSKTGKQAPVAFDVHVDRDSRSIAIVTDGGKPLIVDEGEWSEFIPLHFEFFKFGSMLPGGAMDGIARFYLRSLDPLYLYMSPINFDPEAAAIPMSEPSTASEDLAAEIGSYYTQGMAEEVNGLKDELLTNEEFVAQADIVYDERVAMMEHALDMYMSDEAGGLLFFYYSTVDLCCHMLWQHSDHEHPFHNASFASEDNSWWTKREGSTWKDIVHDLYLKMDPVLGRVRERVGDDTAIVVMSDHGFAPWRRKVSLNRWLLDEGYLVLTEGVEPEAARRVAQADQRTLFVPVDHDGDPATPPVSVVDWSKTRAYGMGFNGLYINLLGREGVDPETGETTGAPGIVKPAERDALVRELKTKLEALKDPKDGARVVYVADVREDVYAADGERLSESPDILVGFDAGYGNSDASATGRISWKVFEDNDGGTFNGNHLMASEVVAGTLLTNQPVADGDHALEDLTVEILKRYKVQPDSSLHGHRVLK